MDDIREAIATTLREEWPKKISKDIRHHCIDSMPARIQAVIDEKGYYTKYWATTTLNLHGHIHTNRSGIQLHFELSYVKNLIVGCCAIEVWKVDDFIDDGREASNDGNFLTVTVISDEFLRRCVFVSPLSFFEFMEQKTKKQKDKKASRNRVL
jgi:hypothetical protein